MNKLIAILSMKPLKITDSIFKSEEEKELFFTSSKEQQLIFIRDNIVEDLVKDFEIQLINE